MVKNEKKTHGASIPDTIWQWLGELLENPDVKPLLDQYGINTRTKLLIVLARAGEGSLRKDAIALKERLDRILAGKPE